MGVKNNIKLRIEYEKQTGKNPVTTLDLPGNAGFCCFSDYYIEWLEDRVDELYEQHDYIGRMLNNKTDQLKVLRYEVKSHEKNQELLKNKIKEKNNEIEFLNKEIRLRNSQLQNHTRKLNSHKIDKCGIDGKAI